MKMIKKQPITEAVYQRKGKDGDVVGCDELPLAYLVAYIGDEQGML